MSKHTITIKDDQYVVSLGWMSTKAGLKGVRKEVFAIIYGYSQDGESVCNCSLRRYELITGSNTRTIQRHIKALIADGLIIPTNKINQYGTNEYIANLDLIEKIKKGDKFTPMTNDPVRVDKLSREGVAKDPDKVDKLSHYNKESNNIIKESKAETELSKKWKEWIDYKKGEHGFKYKMKSTEDRAKKRLWKLSGENEKNAIEILDHTMSNTWKGFVIPDELKKQKKKAKNYVAPRRTVSEKIEVNRDGQKKIAEMFKNALSKPESKKPESKNIEKQFIEFLKKWSDRSGITPDDAKIKELKDRFISQNKTA